MKKQDILSCWGTFVLILTMVHSFFGQVDVTGKVIEPSGEFMSFAHVLLLKYTDSALVKGTITDENGRFFIKNVKPGNYILNTSMVGYENFYSPNITIQKKQKNIEYGTIKMREDAHELDGVTITTKKPLYEKQVDRTVINVQNSITSTGGTALEVLEKSPGVVVNRQNSSISMSGKSGVLVMINGKINRLPVDAVVQMLDGMSAANIEKIELITTPPAKYEAEGDAGIIHIVMTQSPDLGTNGNFGSTLGRSGAGIWGANVALNHRTEHINTFMTYSMRSDATETEWTSGNYFFDGNFEHSNTSVNIRRPETRVHNLRVGLEFELREKTVVSLLGTGYERRWETNDVINTVNIMSPESMVLTSAEVFELNKFQNVEGSLGLAHKFNDTQKLSLELDYLYALQDQPSNYKNNTRVNNSAVSNLEFVEVEKRTPINFKIFSLDYSNVFDKKSSFEAGVKGSFSKFKNDVSTQRTVGEITTSLPEFTGNSRLSEDILAAYASFKWQPTDQWNLETGIRNENTSTVLTTREEGIVVDRNLNNLFPNVLVSYSFNEKSKLNLAYNRRINRPRFNDLAPFVFFINPTTALAGNLELRSTITDGLDLSYQFKKWWVSFKYSYAKNAIVPFQPAPVTDGVLLLRSENLKYLQNYSVSVTAPVKLTSWWELRNDATLSFVRLETRHLENNIRERATSLVYNGISSFLLPKDFTIEVTGNYQSSFLFGLYNFHPMGRLDIGLKKKLKDNWGTLTLVGADLLGTQVWKGNSNTSENNIRSDFIYDFGLRSVTLSYTKTFGNKKLKEVEFKSATEEEKKRVN